MRITIIAFIAIAMSCTCFAQSGLFFSTSEEVHLQSNLFRPRIALINDNTAVIVWGNILDKRIYFSARTTSGFTSPLSISDSREAYIADWTGPEIAASGDTIYVVFSSYPAMAPETYLIRSFDGGTNFSDTLRIDSLEFAEISRFPSVAIMAGGNPVVNYMVISLMGEEYAVARSLDGGTTFQPKFVASDFAPGSVCDCCPAQVITENNRVVLMFRNNDNNKRNIWAALSTNYGLTYPISEDVDQTDWMINACPSTGPDGHISGSTLYTVWASAAEGARKVYISSSSLFDLTQIQRKKLFDFTSSGTQQNYPRIAGSGDTIGVVWQHSQLANTIILFSYSTTGIAGIGTIIDTISISGQGHQVNPDIAFANGVFHITWKDNFNNKIMYRQASFTPLAVKDPVNNFSIEIYPNPADKEIYISEIKSSEFSFHYVLTNVTGQKILEEQFSGITSIPVSHLPAGLYFINIYLDGKIVAKEKIMLQ